MAMRSRGEAVEGMEDIYICEGHNMPTDEGQGSRPLVADGADEDNQGVARLGRSVSEGNHSAGGLQVISDGSATAADEGVGGVGLEADTDSRSGGDGQVCVAIVDDALPSTFQRKCIDVTVSKDATVGEVVAAVRALTVCYWEGSVVSAFAAELSGEWLPKSQAGLPNVRELYCADVGAAVDFSATLKELLGGAIHTRDIVHLVVKLQALAPSSVFDDAHVAFLNKFRDFKRFTLTTSWQPIDASAFTSEQIVPVDLSTFSCLNDKLPAAVAFPSRFFMRVAEHRVLSILAGKLQGYEVDLSALSLVLVGSPGVGKSTLAQILAWQVSHLWRRDVLHVHHVRQGFVFFKFFTVRGDLVCGDLDVDAVPHLAVMLQRVEGRAIDPVVIVDGFEELPQTASHVVVTSDTSNAFHLSQRVVLLPSWSQRDVDLVVQRMENPSTVSQRYMHYGGDLRSILAEDQGAAKATLAMAVCRISENPCGRSMDQVDHIRRLSVLTPEDDASYENPLYWVGRIESSDLRRLLIHHEPLPRIQRLVEVAKGSPLYASAHAMGCHCTAAKTNSLVLTPVSSHAHMQDKAVYEIAIDTAKTVFRGRTPSDFPVEMIDVATGAVTYLAPEFPSVDGIDAVARCVIKSPSGDENAIAILQYAVDTQATLVSQATISSCHEILEAETQMPVVRIYVTPPGCKINAPISYGIDSYTAQFDVGSPTSLTPEDDLMVSHVTSIPLAFANE